MTLVAASGWPSRLTLFENMGVCTSGPSYHNFNGTSTGLHLFGCEELLAT